MTPAKTPRGYSVPVLLPDGQIIEKICETWEAAIAACAQYEHDIKTKQVGGIMLGGQ